MAEQQVKVPDIGGAEGAEVIELLVEVGDTVEVEQSLLVLESDKASMEIPSSLAGTIKEILVKVGDELAEGSPIAVVEVEGESGDGEESASSESDASDGDSDGDEESGEADKSAEKADAKADDKASAKESGGSDDKGETASKGGSREVTVEIPDIGTEDAVDLIELCIQVGDEVGEGDSLVVLESDKASMEVPAPQAGKLVKWLVKEGGTVRQGDQLAVLAVAGGADDATADESETDGDEADKDSPEAGKEQAAKREKPQGDSDSRGSSAASESPAKSSSRPSSGAAESPSNEPAARSDGELVYAGPAVRKLAREFGVDITQVVGTGPRDRVLKEDVQTYVQRALNNRGASAGATGGAGIPPIPEVDFAAFGEVESVARSKMDKLTAANMHRSWLNVPHVTQWDDADITELEAFRASLKGEAEKRGTKLTPVPFLLKACAIALRDNPKFNASLSTDGENLVYKRYFHIGMAVDTPAGLVVPVIRDVDQKSIWELAEEVIELAGKARDRKLKPQEMQGGCFTISSLGNIGGRGFTPIVNPPEVGILGISRASVQPVWDGEAFQPRKMLPLALSYDHRVINGGDAGRFCTQLVGLLGDIRRLLM
ncbi:dihydrolipoyllysine-residue acetyltransferase [Haliea atlantica]